MPKVKSAHTARQSKLSARDAPISNQSGFSRQAQQDDHRNDHVKKEQTMPYVDRVQSRPSRWRRKAGMQQPDAHDLTKDQEEDNQQQKPKRRPPPGVWPSASQSVYDPVPEQEQPTPPFQEQPKVIQNFSNTGSIQNFNVNSYRANQLVLSSPRGGLQYPFLPIQGTFAGQTVVPVLEKPEKREGYGFSYTDSLFCDSDDNSNTEVGDDNTDGDTVVDHELYSPNLFPPRHVSFLASSGANLLRRSREGEPSTDVLVMRDVGSFHMARPERKFKCTIANREITLHMQHLAKGLMLYSESQDVSSNLLERMERMFVAASKEAWSKQHAPQSLILHSANKLRDVLVEMKQKRIETGEYKRYVLHEIEWAEWLVKACEHGVMHVKTGECGCLGEWDE